MNQRDINSLAVNVWNLYSHLSIVGRDCFATRFGTVIAVLGHWNNGYCTCTNKLARSMEQFYKELQMRRSDPTFWVENSKTSFSLFED
jgi:hypothetical protein